MYAVLPRHSVFLLPVSRLPATDSSTSTLTCCSETRHKTLEEIASAFGDKVVTLTDRDLAVEQTVFEGKAAAGHIESGTEDER